MEAVRMEVVVTPEAREAAVRRAILGNGTGLVRLTSGQRRALAGVAQRLSPAPVQAAGSSA